MAGNSVYKVGIVISADAAAVKPGVATAKAEIASIGTTAAETETRMQRLIATATGLHVGAANGNQRAWTGALAAEGLALDNLRAKYNPLFAVIQQYKAAQTEIRTAHAMGALSSDEMTAALQRQRQAALGAIDALKGRNTAMSSSGSNGRNFAATNLMFQAQDTVMTAAMGMDPKMIALQQGSQVAGAVAGMSMKEAGTAITGAFTQLLSPVSLAAVAITGLTAAAIQYGMSAVSSTNKAEQALKNHAETLERIRDLTQEATAAQSRYGSSAQGMISFTANRDRYLLEGALSSQLSSLAGNIGPSARQLRGDYMSGEAPTDNYIVAQMRSRYGAFAEAVVAFSKEARNGKGDIQAFNDEIVRIANQNAADAKLQEMAKWLLDAGKAATDTAAAVSELNKELLATTMVSARTAAATAANAYNRQNNEAQFYMRRQQDAAIADLNARSPAEIEAATRARLEAEPVDPARETAETRQMRIGNEATLARLQAEKALADAKRDRVRSIDETVASQQLELSLIGRTISETEALRMQYQLTAQLKAEAAKNGVAVDQDELRLIEEKARAYGRLAEQIAATNAIREQDETIQQLQTELSLVGASDDARRRALATLEAEQRIRQLGINASSAEAQQIRERASAISEMTEQLRRQNEAWNKVRGSAENTIDSMVDGLVDGDISGALESVAKDITSTFLELSVKNPLKNALLGTSYGTLGDVGGLGGIVSKLFGGGDVSAIGGAGAVGSMSVQAGSVMVNGSVVGSAMSALGVDRMFSPANGNAANAAGGSDIQSQVWNFFAGKGLQSHQIAGIMGNINAESAFNPLAVGDSGNALGLFQHNDRASALLAAIGGQGNLGNVGSQLDFAWNELNTSERASLQRLLASTDVRGATSAFAGFERPRGWSLSNPEGADNYVGRLKGAEAALERFGNTTTTATQGLGTLGSGFDQFGRNLTNWFPAAPSGGGGMGGLLGGLFGGGLSSFGQSVFGSSAQFASAWQAGGVGLYSGGGYTGAGGVYEPRGIVHAGEVVWSQADVARHGGVSNVEAMRIGARLSGYASGGAVGVSALPYAANASRFVQREERMPSIQIINQTSTPITGEVQEGQDEGGRRQSRLIISDEMGAAAQQKGGGFQKAMSRQYGLRPRGIPR